MVFPGEVAKKKGFRDPMKRAAGPLGANHEIEILGVLKGFVEPF